MTAALVRRFEAHGGVIHCSAPVASIDVSSRGARGVRLEGGERITARRAVIADVNAMQLYRGLLPTETVPTWLQRDLDRFQWDSATVKLDWNLDGPIPWTAENARRAGTVHIAESTNELSQTASELTRGLVPKDPFLLFGQYSMADPTRSPIGKETAWAYTHIPASIRGDAGGDGLGGPWSSSDLERFADRMQDQIEALAPGFGALVRSRAIAGPADIEGDNPNLVHGAINGGTAALHQQLVFRPVPGLARSETVIPRLYLGSASAHPGGGIHGAAGANAARAAPSAYRRPVLTHITRSVGARLMGGPSVLP